MLDAEALTILQTRLAAQTEWLLINRSGKSFAARNSEIEIERARDRLLLSFLDDRGFQTWRVAEYKFSDSEIIFRLTRNFGKETEKMRFVPRASAASLQEEIILARLEKAHEIAALIAENHPQNRLIGVKLNEANGRYAQIIFENSSKRRIAALADVSDALSPEMLLSFAVFWLARLQNRKKNPIDDIWIVGDKKTAKKLQKLLALLIEKWKGGIFIVEIVRPKIQKKIGDSEENEKSLSELPCLPISDLWLAKPGKIQPLEKTNLSLAAQEIMNLAPNETDVIFSKSGETVRFHGLPLARVRKTLGAERVWFGIEKNRVALAENNRKDLRALVENLKIYRCYDSPNKRHAFYALAAEAWLEAILRKNIRLLDANLILSPVYHQFRAEREKIDLLALRRDGRLVIIEVKTAPDREMIFQVADYWRKIEFQRRSGNLQAARIFGDLEISAKPAIIYLVAPTLSFHQDFDFLAAAISPEIEIHRFELAENWRENLKVLQRKKI